MPALASSWALSHNVKGLGSIPGQGTCLSCGFGHQSGCVQQATDQCFSHNLLSLSFFLPSPLSGINEKKKELNPVILKLFQKNRKENTSKLILRGQHYPDTKARQKHCKKTTANISHE